MRSRGSQDAGCEGGGGGRLVWFGTEGVGMGEGWLREAWPSLSVCFRVVPHPAKGIHAPLLRRMERRRAVMYSVVLNDKNDNTNSEISENVLSPRGTGGTFSGNFLLCTRMYVCVYHVIIILCAPGFVRNTWYVGTCMSSCIQTCTAVVLVVRVLGNNIPVLRTSIYLVLLGYGYLLLFMLALEVQV